MNAKIPALLLGGLMLPAVALAQTAPVPVSAAKPDPAASDALRFSVPKAISPEAKAILTPAMAGAKALAPTKRAMALDFPKLRATSEAGAEGRMAVLATKLGLTYSADTIAGVPVLRLLPRDAAADGRVLVYVHGGGWIGGSVKSTFASPANFAAATGLPVIGSISERVSRAEAEFRKRKLRMFAGAAAALPVAFVGLLGVEMLMRGLAA